MRSSRAIWMCMLLLVIAAVPAAWADVPTLKPIAIDGNNADWQTVLQNAFNTTTDGFGYNVAPCSSSTDRDCAQIGNIGRDIKTFAWTYDPLVPGPSTYISLYLELYADAPSAQDFFFYFDADGDQRMERSTGSPDRVVHVNYSSGSGATPAYYRYLSADVAIGDRLDDGTTNCGGAGCSDGYNMPGGIQQILPTPPSLAAMNFATGKGFEVRISWADLGIAPGSAAYFHVGSGHNTNLPGGLDDNCGGPDDKIGRFAFRSLIVDPDGSGAIQSGQSIEYLTSVTNNGTQPGVVEFRAVSTAGLEVEIERTSDNLLLARDTNGDGDFTDALPGEGIFNDTNANASPDNGDLAVGATYQLRVRLTDLSGLDNVTDTTVLTGYFAVEPSANDIATFTTAIGDLTLVPNGAKPGIVGTSVDYGHTLTNRIATDTFSLQALSTQGWPVTYFTDPNADGNPGDGIQLAHDQNGDGDFCDAGDTAPGAPCTALPSTPSLAQGASWSFVLRIAVPAATPFGTVDVTTVTARASAVNSFRSASATDTTTASDLFSITPSYLNCFNSGRFGAAGASTYFPFVIANNQFSYTAVSDNVTLAVASAANGACAAANAGWTRRFWTDPNGDGNVADGVITTAVSVARNGGQAAIVLEVLIPAAPANLTDRSNVTATLGANNRTTAGELKVSKIVPYTDAGLTNQGSFFTRCQTLFVQGLNLVASQVNRYRLDYIDPGATVRRTTMPSTDPLGQFSDSYTFTATDLGGNWTVRVTDTNGSILVDQITVVVEPVPPAAASMTASLDKLGYADGDSVVALATLTNSNTFADFTGTTVEWVLRFDGAPQRFLDSGNSWGLGSTIAGTTAGVTVNAASASPVSRGFGPLVFPGSGAYTLTATWKGSCGNVIATASRIFYANVVGDTLLAGVPQTTFYRTETVTTRFQTVLAATSYVVAYYDGNGVLVGTGTATSDGSGVVTHSLPTNDTMAGGSWTAVLYPAAYTPPGFVSLADPNRIASVGFTVNPFPTLLRNASVTDLATAATMYPGIFTQVPPPNSLQRPRDECTSNYSETGLMDWCGKSTDYADDTKPLIFYEMPLATSSLRVTKGAGNTIVIVYTAPR